MTQELSPKQEPKRVFGIFVWLATIATIVSGVAAVLVVPEVREFFGLEPSATPSLSTPSMTPVTFVDVPVPISDFANADILELLPEFPVGEQIFEGVKFFIPNQDNSLHTECERTSERHPKFEIPLDHILHPESIYVLINAGYTAGYGNTVIGTMEFNFADGRSFSRELILGQNIREWLIGAAKVHEGAVVSANSSDHTQIHRGQSAPDTSGPGVQDMLKVDVPDEYKDTELKSIVFRDVMSGDPCLLIAGLTIRVRSGP